MALRDGATHALRLDGLVSYVHPENLASAAIADRLGAILDPNAFKPGPSALVYRHLGRNQR
jgi:RimJ/RimL family protein N-acetyltransferase